MCSVPPPTRAKLRLLCADRVTRAAVLLWICAGFSSSVDHGYCFGGNGDNGNGEWHSAKQRDDQWRRLGSEQHGHSLRFRSKEATRQVIPFLHFGETSESCAFSARFASRQEIEGDGQENTYGGDFFPSGGQ